MFFGLTLSLANPAAAAGGWTPAELFGASEAGAWYDPSDLSTLYQTNDTSTPVTADGQTVGRMEDKSGNGNHITQATAARRPLYKTDGTYHWLTFDNSDDYLVRAALGLVNSPEFSFSTGLSGVDNPSILDVIFSEAENASSASYFLFRFTDSGGIKWNTHLRDDAFASKYNLAHSNTISAAAQVMTFSDNGVDEINLYRNGAASAESPFSYTRSGVYTMDWFSMFALVKSTPGNYAAGNFFGGVFISRVFTASEQVAVESYMADKAGVTL